MRPAGPLVEILYPCRAICMGCDSGAGLERDWLCEECRMELARSWLGAVGAPKGGLILGAACAYRYGGPAGSMVRNLKYRGIWRLAEMMGPHMARAFEALRPTCADCVVPVPMHSARLRQRGFNHAEMLAVQAAGPMGLPVENALARVRNTPQQARLGDAERLKNMKGAFALRRDVSGRGVILVDDVCTTGATANECAEVLLAGGAHTVYLLCFAAARGGEDH